MIKKYCLLIVLASLILTSGAEAQIYLGGRIGGGFGYGGGYGRIRGGGGRRTSRPKEKQPYFKPVVYVSFGYGFPNLDANQLPNNPYVYGYTQGNISSSGPITGSIDYRFSRNTSIGVMTTYGKVSAPYSNGGTVSLENWSVMLNFMQYAPMSNTATLYFRGAIGANIPTTTYSDQNTANNLYFSSDALAYQVGLGARFDLTSTTALFAEAGYGKYILHGGISFAFK